MTKRNDLDALLKLLYPVETDKTLIRLGPDGDGGYLVPDDLIGIEACISPGVCFTSGFEKACADLGMKVLMADASVDQPATFHPSFHFTKKYVGAITNDNFITIDSWVSSCISSKTSDLLLQIDIEGYEYETFLAMSDSLMKRYRVIVVEFHSLDQLLNRPFFQLVSSVFHKIRQTHTCVHIHPNKVIKLI
jgi:hypothetical protein